MKIFISGGCKNGKSTDAQTLAKQLSEGGLPLYYVATMEPRDREDDARVENHRRERAGWGFETVEQGKNLCEVLFRTDPRGVYLLDSVTALVSNEMFSSDRFDPEAGERVCADLTRFLGAVDHAVLVSDFIYSDAGLYDPLVEEYRRALALCDRAAAAACDCVIEVSAGCMTVHKGCLP